MAKILTDTHNDSSRIRNQIWAIGAMHRGTMRTGGLDELPWSVEEARWLVSAETEAQAVREIAKQHSFDLQRWSWDERGQRCLFIMPWDRYYTDQVGHKAEIRQITEDGQVVHFHRRWS